MGDRMDNIQPGAMPWLHRYVGNPVLSGILNLFFRTGVARRPLRDARRPPRRAAAARPAHDRHGVRLRDGRSAPARSGSRSREIPIDYHPREGESKLSSFRDGWRHLRFLLVHSPNWLFIVPGAVMATLGVLVALTVLLQIEVFGREWDLHAMVAGALLMIVGHAGARARPVRARVRHLLHGREGPVVRPHARAASGSSTA